MASPDSFPAETAQSLAGHDSLILAIFGTARATHAIIGDRNGWILRPPAIRENAALSPMVSNAADALSVLTAVCKQLGSPDAIERIRHITLACSGAAGEMYQQVFESVLRLVLSQITQILPADVTHPIRVLPDFRAVLAATRPIQQLRADCGFVVMSGSGSVIHLAVSSDSTRLESRHGGYGSPFPGDAGSSYDIGLRLLDWVSRTLDSYGWPPEGQTLADDHLRVIHMVLDHLDRHVPPASSDRRTQPLQTDIALLRQEIKYHAAFREVSPQALRGMIAELARIPCACASAVRGETRQSFYEMKSSAAEGLVSHFSPLLERHSELLQKLGEQTPVPVMLEGGSFRCGAFREVVSDLLVKSAESRGIKVTVQPSLYFPVVGAYILALEETLGRPLADAEMHAVRTSAAINDLLIPDDYTHQADRCQ